MDQRVCVRDHQPIAADWVVCGGDGATPRIVSLFRRTRTLLRVAVQPANTIAHQDANLGRRQLCHGHAEKNFAGGFQLNL